MKTLKILRLFGLECLEELPFNLLYRITNTYLFLLLLCLKNKVTFEKLLKLRGVQNELEVEVQNPPTPSNSLKKP